MKQILIATMNNGKVKEFESMLQPLGYEVKSLLDLPQAIDVEETGLTFEENAQLKSDTIAAQFQIPVVADDSGLEVDYLDGRPGVYSARYAGLEKSDQKNMDKLVDELKNVHDEKDRSARFVCVLSISIPGEATKTVRGTCEGYIAKEPRGENGFGYDPIFILKDQDKTMAELTKEEKNKISHRANALKKLKALLY
ncbi:XTP/dITP diphosphatase [Bacillus weihaiensis]|uniref:XTP/dITP diphosphatase n=1 Tax=Bacillus weihaiensis TaxID=1547283 RepID=UPI002357413F|nr:XTP/dITP diphosphatase [Bacillus weihaiensis]